MVVRHMTFTYQLQLICQKYQKSIGDKYLKKINIYAIHVTRKKSCSIKASLLREISLQFLRYFSFFWHFPDVLTMCTCFVAYSTNLAHRYGVHALSTIFPPSSDHWFCNTAICWRKLNQRQSLNFHAFFEIGLKLGYSCFAHVIIHQVQLT